MPSSKPARAAGVKTRRDDRAKTVQDTCTLPKRRKVQASCTSASDKERPMSDRTATRAKYIEHRDGVSA